MLKRRNNRSRLFRPINEVDLLHIDHGFDLYPLGEEDWPLWLEEPDDELVLLPEGWGGGDVVLELLGEEVGWVF